VKYSPTPSNDKLEHELSVVYRNEPFANAKFICVLLNLLKENNLENTILEMHKLVETAITTPA
jgi:hypothetical protein